MNVQATYNRVFSVAEFTHALKSLFQSTPRVHHDDTDDIDFGDLTVEQEQIDVASKTSLPKEGERGIVYKAMDTLDLFVWKGSQSGWQEFKPYEEAAIPQFCGSLDDHSCTFSGNGTPRTRLANALRALIDDTRSIENNSLMNFTDWIRTGDMMNQERTYDLKRDSVEAVYNAFVHRAHPTLIRLIREHMRGNTNTEFYTAVENLGAVARYDPEAKRVIGEFRGCVNEQRPYEIRVATRVYKVFV